MRPGSLFSDGMVLQRNRPLAVWGETLPDVLVKAEINGNEGFAKSSRSGDFLLHLPPMEAGGPFELKISVPGYADESVTLHDIMIGEVWLCSGQSNMEYKLESSWALKQPEPGTLPVSRRQEKDFLETEKNPEEIRFITVPMKATGCREKYFEASWRKMNSTDAPKASAAGAWFGLNLWQELKVPVGLICCAWGGSDIETWTSPSALKSNPDTRAAMERWERESYEEKAWTHKAVCKSDMSSLIRETACPDRGNHGFRKGWADPSLDDSDWGTMQIPGSWIKDNIAGCGAVWIRKKVIIPESQAGRDLVLKTGAVDKHDITYFNGTEIGRTGKNLETDCCGSPRTYTVPGRLVRAGVNVIALRAFSFILDGAFRPPDTAYVLSGAELEIPLAGVWKVKAEYDLGRITFPPPPYGIGNHNTPGFLFDSMIRPLIPFTIRGVIWYQGENNATSPVDPPRTYLGKMETMIRDWRFHWEQPELPFIQVQLAGFHAHLPYDRCSSWAELRDAQRRACLTLPGVFMITALDTGEENDIHPQNKKDIGIRLAASALHHIYGRNVLPSGPEYRNAVPENGSLRVFFDYAEGLTLRDLPEKSFFLAGADRFFYPADKAEISGNSILLASDNVKEPLFVRYAWADNPANILWNRKYPAASFSSEKPNSNKEMV